MDHRSGGGSKWLKIGEAKHQNGREKGKGKKNEDAERRSHRARRGRGPEWPSAKTEATLSNPWQPSADATTDQSSQALQRPSIRATERLSSPTPEARLRPASKCNELEQNDCRDQATTELIQQQQKNKNAEARHQTVSQATNQTINQLM